jgi:hypothetical protein
MTMNEEFEQELNETALVPATEMIKAIGFKTEVNPDEVMTIPRARLAQGLTSEVISGEAQAGSWILPGGRVVSEIAGTLVGYRKTRTLWDNNVAQPTVLCRSSDGETGIGEPGGLCETCPKSHWNNQEPPECTLNHEFLIFMKDSTPIVVTMSSRSARHTVGQLLLALRMRKSLPVKIRSQLVTKGNRKYYIPVAEFDW